VARRGGLEAEGFWRALGWVEDGNRRRYQHEQQRAPERNVLDGEC